MRPGSFREMIVIEEPIESQSDIGEMIVTWRPWRRVRASVENMGFYATLRAAQSSADVSHVLRMYYQEGLSGSMRIRWESRGDRMLYISSVVEQGNRQYHEVMAEERANG